MAKSRHMFTLQGDKKLQRLCKELPQRVIKSGLRKAVNAAATPVVKLARGKAPKQSGLLRKSIGKKVKTYKSGKVVAIIGPRRETVGEYKGKKRVPGNYAHLVERTNPFLNSALESARNESTNIAKDKLRESIISEAKKLARS